MRKLMQLLMSIGLLLWQKCIVPYQLDVNEIAVLKTKTQSENDIVGLRMQQHKNDRYNDSISKYGLSLHRMHISFQLLGHSVYTEFD